MIHLKSYQWLLTSNPLHTDKTLAINSVGMLFIRTFDTRWKMVDELKYYKNKNNLFNHLTNDGQDVFIFQNPFSALDSVSFRTNEEIFK